MESEDRVNRRKRLYKTVGSHEWFKYLQYFPSFGVQ